MTFQFRPVLTIAMLIALAILISLGVWQLQRLEWKQDLIASVAERMGDDPVAFEAAARQHLSGDDSVYTPVTIEGTFRHDLEFHVFGAWEAQPGWYIFTPLESADGEMVMVNRGFVPNDVKDRDTRQDGLVEGPVTVTGLFREPEEPSGIAKMVSAPSNAAANEYHVRDPRLWQRDGFSGEQAAGNGFYIDSFGGENPGIWPKGGTTRLEFNNRHFEYAMTWFGLAAAMLGVFFVFSLKRKA